MTIPELFAKHGLTQKAAAELSGVPLATVNDVIRGRRDPRVGTVNRLLAFARRYEPGVTYEELFAPELCRPEAA